MPMVSGIGWNELGIMVLRRQVGFNGARLMLFPTRRILGLLAHTGGDGGKCHIGRGCLLDADERLEDGCSVRQLTANICVSHKGCRDP